MLDVLVIGAGLAGLLTALGAAEAGLRVRVVAKGLGAHHWNAGTVDVLGYLPGEPFAVENPFEAMAGLPEQHPYRLLGAERAAAAVESFRVRMERAGLPYVGAASAGRSLLLPSPVGAVRPTLLAPAAQAAGDVRDPQPMLIVGVEGLRDTFPHLIAENLNKQGFAARAAFVPWEAVSHQRDRNPVQLAEDLDDPKQRAKLAAALKPLVRPGERIGFPAILGIAEHAAVRAELQAATGATLFEFPTLPPSVPGVRLWKALRQALLSLGVRVESNMEVAGFGVENGAVAWVETAAAARPLRHRARAFVLATGGLLGGGFATDHTGAVRETVFNLPLTVAPDRSQWFRPHFLDPRGQPIFHGGVAVGPDFRPLDANGAPAFANVWAAGGVLAHTDPILERSLEGLAIATGAAVAQALAAALLPAPVMT